MDPKARAFLLDAQNDDGGWGYAAGHASTVEATAAALLALATDATDAANRASDWLLTTQNPDGGWGLTSEDAASGWQTAWAVLALQQVSPAAEAARRGVDWLLNVPLMPRNEEEDIRWVKATLGIDPTLRGWPWLPGQAGWVEPTALTILALAPLVQQPEIRARLDEAVRYLEDRRCVGGGWNVGNPVMFSSPLPARACPTAWVLLALASFAPAAVQTDDLTTLRQEMASDGSASALSWGLLALHALDQDDAPAQARLRASQDADGSWSGNPFYTATAALALSGGLLGRQES